MKKQRESLKRKRQRNHKGRGYAETRRDKTYARNESYNIALWFDRSATSAVIYRLTYKSSFMLTQRAC